MSRTLGIDLGTNSIGWAIVDQESGKKVLVDRGVHIFQEGVNRVKGNEEPSVKTRTEARASRRHYFRRRLRKIELLKILVRESLCPYLSESELKEWREKKLFPLNPDFLQWLKTDDVEGANPYYDRHRCLNETLDLKKKEDRYSLGRALYHINQRRGFLSNRKDQSSADEEGKVKTEISNLDNLMKESGYEYLGDYFYHLYASGMPIRKKYTDRKEHYVKEFRAICRKQGIDEALEHSLYNAIFYQRPLKSQKGLVGKCPFESNKTRCQMSHPDFEEFRMLSFINNIRIAKPGEVMLRGLKEEEKALILPLFTRKSKANFDFSDISKKLAGKGVSVIYSTDGAASDVNTFRVNFRDYTNVCGCPVTSQFASLFGDDWRSAICEQYLLSGGKTEQQIIDDVWHTLTFFDSDDMLIRWAVEKLQLSSEDAKSFAEIKVPQGYASLSLCAIRKILPWLRAGYRYDEAAMLANIRRVVPVDTWDDPERQREVIDTMVRTVTTYVPDSNIKNDSKLRKIEEDLCNLGIFDLDMEKLYHPSKIEVYPKSLPNKDGLVLLQSPRTDSVRNPMAMRSLFRLRALVNELIKDGKIDRDTKINIELSRNLNDFNTRRAIEILQRDNAKRRAEYRNAISEYFSQNGLNYEPTEEDLLKYELWEEQKHVCLYTGKQIHLSGFLGANPQFDIEHTVPRSRGGDNSKANKTLCECRFNREVKKGRLPSELANWEEILARVEATGMEERMDALRKDISKSSRAAKAAADKDSKDRAVQRRHLAKMQLDYYSDKLRRFKMKDVPEGFTNRQGVDIGIIGRYARMYMQSVFDRVYTVKGETTAEFRNIWGLQDNYSKKERVNHSHHCIDAITIACIGKAEYDQWAQYKRDREMYMYGGGDKPEMPKPWKTFTEDVKQISENLLVSHYTPDNLLKPTKKVLRRRGVIQRDESGRPLYVQGDSARGSLHLQTFYGAIERDGEIKYVVRKELASLSDKDIKNIVDDAVREKVEAAVSANGISALQSIIWMNEEKRIPIRKVRLFAPTVTNPLTLKKQRFASEYEYKRDYYVANESNYAIGIYEGIDGKGRRKKSFRLVNNLSAAQIAKANQVLLPDRIDNCYDLLYVLKIGTMVLFYENDKSEVFGASQVELSRRLYKTVGISIMRVQQYEYGQMSFLHHEEARPSTEIKYNKGPWVQSDPYRAKIEINHNQIKALVEGYDFIISTSGKIKFINR